MLFMPGNRFYEEGLSFVRYSADSKHTLQYVTEINMVMSADQHSMAQRSGLASSEVARPAQRPGRQMTVVGVNSGDVAVQVDSGAVGRMQERRRRRRVRVASMYSFATVRMLGQRTGPIEGYVIDVSETGLALEVDTLIPVGQTVTVQFRIAGLGALRHETWAEYAAAAEVVRHEDVDDFPSGPYRIGLRFVRVSTMTQAKIARFVATQPG